MNKWFHNIKVVCSIIAILLFIWMNCKVWIPSFGGQFPYRVRGPLAKHEYYQLSEFEDWENFLQIPGSDKTASELLIEAKPIPILELTRPDEPLPVEGEDTSTEIDMADVEPQQPNTDSGS